MGLPLCIIQMTKFSPMVNQRWGRRKSGVTSHKWQVKSRDRFHGLHKRANVFISTLNWHEFLLLHMVPAYINIMPWVKDLKTGKFCFTKPSWIRLENYRLPWNNTNIYPEVTQIETVTISEINPSTVTKK